MKKNLPITADPDALDAWAALTPEQRGAVVTGWFKAQHPSLKGRYKRERYSLGTFEQLLTETEAALAEANEVTVNLARRIAQCQRVEGSLTAAQVVDPAYPALKLRLDALTTRQQAYYETLKLNRSQRQTEQQ